jgi:hypothetical protein
MRLLKIILLLLFFTCRVQAQFMVGWTGGHCNPRELNKEIYTYNVLNSANTKAMHELHWFQGPTFGIRAGDDVFFELMYNRKKATTAAEFDSAGVPMVRQMKVFGNTFNFGFGTKVGNWAFGGSMDFGRFKGFGKRGQEATIKDQDWRRLWVVDRTRILGISVRLYFAGTFWVERSFGILTVRLYTQPIAFKQTMDGLEGWFFGADLNYGKGCDEAFKNTGIAIYLNLGKK